MTSGIVQRFRRWLTRLGNGEISLIADDRWLPNPIDDPRFDRAETSEYST
jgi:hypothetical protein